MAATKTIRDRSRWRRRKSTKAQTDYDDDDWGSLTWLLSFRLDELVNINKTNEDTCNVNDRQTSIVEASSALKKPPHTYPELIERALREKGELTVSGIYQWISDRFPYYKANDERWKNSVRHNLSINPHFRKGARSSQGAGHLWSLAANAIDLLPIRNDTIYLNEKTDDEPLHTLHILDCPKVIVLDEAALAAASILPDQEFLTGSTMFLNPVSSEQVVRECGLLGID